LKKLLSVFFLVCAAVLFLAGQPITVEAKEADTIKEGVYAGDISLSGMTKEEAFAEINAYVDSLKECLITLKGVEQQAVTVKAEELGIYWSNPEIIDEALVIGTKGNVIERYKMLKDLEYENKIYEIAIDFNVENINNVLVEKCTVYDRPAQDFGLKRENGEFVITEGATGYRLDVELSIDTVYNYLVTEWQRDNCNIMLNVEVSEPRGSAELLAKVGDIMGVYTTSFSTSNSSRSANVTNGCHLINGTLLYPGDEFSMMDTVTPFTQANGYYLAGSYLSGKVVDSIGGGICQVSTTLYNAILLAELEVTERYNHSMIVTYVKPSADAAIAESAGKDFKFVNTTDYPIYIEGVTTPDKNITFTIYGVETRPANRVVRYETVILSTTAPGPEVINMDAAQPIGFVDVQSAYTGYKAQLWKIVTVDGVETERTQINSSNYKMVPRTATVGVATADPNAYNEIIAAIGTGSIDHVRNVAAYWQALAPQVPVVAPVAPAEPEPVTPEVPVTPEQPVVQPEQSVTEPPVETPPADTEITP